MNGGLIHPLRKGQNFLAEFDHIGHIEYHPRDPWSVSDIDRLPLNIGTYLRPQCLVSYQIDGTAQQVFQVELDAEVFPPVCRSVKPPQDVNVAVVGSLIAGEGTEEGEFSDAKALRKGRLVRSE